MNPAYSQLLSYVPSPSIRPDGLACQRNFVAPGLMPPMWKPELYRFPLKPMMRLVEVALQYPPDSSTGRSPFHRSPVVCAVIFHGASTLARMVSVPRSEEHTSD